METNRKQVDQSSRDMVGSLLMPMLEKIQMSVDWNQVTDVLSLVLLFKDSQLFIVPIGLGAPDVKEGPLMIGAKLFGISTMAKYDGKEDHEETIECLLADSSHLFDEIRGANTPNNLEYSY